MNIANGISKKTFIIDFNKVHYDGIDLMKYIMAIAVVMIHVGALWNITYPFFITWFIRLAVPYFFITSGFFIFKGALNSNDRKSFFRKRSYRLFRLFIIWIVIYSPLSIWYYVTYDYSLIDSIKSYLLRILISGESYLAWPLWYIYSFAIFSLILSLTNKKLFFYIICGMYLLVYLMEYVHSNCVIASTIPIIKYFYILTHRSLGGGIYLIVGGIIFILSDKYWNIIYPFILLAISLIFRYYELPLWQLIGGAAFFLFGTKIDLRDIGLWFSLRMQSMWIYYSHMIILFFIDSRLRSCHQLPHNQFYNIQISILSVVLCCIFGFLLYRLSQTKTFAKLNLLVK